MRFRDELERELYYSSQIDYCYFVLSKISTEENKPRSPIEIMIDKATGFTKATMLAKIKEIKFLASTIIRCKKQLNYDASADKEFLKQVKKLEKENG